MQIHKIKNIPYATPTSIRIRISTKWPTSGDRSEVGAEGRAGLMGIGFVWGGTLPPSRFLQPEPYATPISTSITTPSTLQTCEDISRLGRRKRTVNRQKHPRNELYFIPAAWLDSEGLPWHHPKPLWSYATTESEPKQQPVNCATTESEPKQQPVNGKTPPRNELDLIIRGTPDVLSRLNRTNG